MITRKNVTDILEKEFGKGIELVQGNGYLYFIDNRPHTMWATESVYVNRLNHLPLNRWLDAGRDFLREQDADAPAPKLPHDFEGASS